MQVIRCEKCGKDIKKDFIVITYHRFSWYDVRTDICKKCFKAFIENK